MKRGKATVDTKKQASTRTKTKAEQRRKKTNAHTENGYEFQKENQLWKLRHKHGRDKIFATAEDLLKAAAEYFELVDESPMYAYEPVGGVLQQVPKKRPYTIWGLCGYFGTNSNYWNEFRRNNSGNPEFSGAIQAIDEVIRRQKFEGAASGFFNANFIARDLEMADKMNTTNANFNSVPMTKDEIKNIQKTLEEEC